MSAAVLDKPSGAAPLSAAADRPRVLVLTPFLPPAPGGAAIYTAILAKGLVEGDFAARVVVVAERHPERPNREVSHDGRLLLLRTAPFRAGRTTRDWRSYVDYGRQQLSWLALPRLVRRQGSDVALVHSSLLYHPGLLDRVLRRLRRGGLKLVLDVRDPKLPAHILAEPGRFDAVVCCAERLERELRQRHPAYADRLVSIPIPIEPAIIGDDLVAATLAKHGLSRGGYLFNANGISREKNSHLLVEALGLLARRRSVPPLAVVGRERDWDANFAAAEQRGQLKRLGLVSHGEVLALSRGAAAVVNPSTIDTPSRVAIEGLMVGAPSLVPAEVPEFERACPQLVCAREPEALATQIGRLLDGELDRGAGYDVEAHRPERVLPRYGALLASLGSFPVAPADR